MEIDASYTVHQKQLRWETSMNHVDYLSDCCDAPPASTVQYSFGKVIGICSACMQWAEFAVEPVRNKKENPEENLQKKKGLDNA